MNEIEVRRLLAAAMAYDNRKPGQAAVLAWGEAADRGRWSFEAALEAVHCHYAESTEFLMPGHITQRLRTGRRADAEQFRALPGPAPASEKARSKAMEMIRSFAGNFGLPREARTARPPMSAAEREAARVELERRRPDLDRLIGGEP